MSNIRIGFVFNDSLYREQTGLTIVISCFVLRGLELMIFAWGPVRQLKKSEVDFNIVHIHTSISFQYSTGICQI